MNILNLTGTELLEHLYRSKLEQLNRAIKAGNQLRRLLLQAEADAIGQELKLIPAIK